jgi:regulator of replication initiation timing
MAPTCAACREPIRSRDALCIADTEVLHRTCAAAGRRTLRWDLEEASARVSAENEALKRQITALRSEAHHKALEVLGLQRRLDVSEAESRAQTEAATFARNEAIRLRAELSALRAQDSALESDAGDARDATVQRFSLLELD